MLYLSVNELHREINKRIKERFINEKLELVQFKKLLREITPDIQVNFYHQEFGCYAKIENKDLKE